MTLEEQLRRDEGVRNKPYVDTVGKITIGSGRNLTDVGLSDDEITYLLQNDIRRVQGQLAGYDWYSKLDEVRQAAVANLCFNVGLGSLLHFPTMLHCLSVQDWKGAAAAALDSQWAKQVGLRANRIADQIETGTWQ